MTVFFKQFLDLRDLFFVTLNKGHERQKLQLNAK